MIIFRGMNSRIPSSSVIFNVFQSSLTGGCYVSDQAGLNRGPLILNISIVTLYTLFVKIE